MQAEYGLQQREPAEWRRVLVTLKLATERTGHLANQLLTLARTESGTLQAESTRPLDLRAVAERVTEEWMPRAIARHIDLGLELDSATIKGDELLIGELLSNLFDNALTYTREGAGSRYAPGPRRARRSWKSRMTGRASPPRSGRRCSAASTGLEGSPGEGCGLGLAIVREIAHLHGADVRIETAASGTGRWSPVRFPAAGGDAGRAESAAASE